MIGPTSWNSANDLRLLKLPNDANLIATVHDYNPFRFTHQGAEWVNPILPVGVTCCSAAQEAPPATRRQSGHGGEWYSTVVKAN